MEKGKMYKHTSCLDIAIKIYSDPIDEGNTFLSTVGYYHTHYDFFYGWFEDVRIKKDDLYLWQPYN